MLDLSRKWYGVATPPRCPLVTVAFFLCVDSVLRACGLRITATVVNRKQPGDDGANKMGDAGRLKLSGRANGLLALTSTGGNGWAECPLIAA